MLVNLRCGTSNVWSGVRMCLDILDCWHGIHVRAHAVTCLLRPCHTNLLATILRVVRILGCDKLWMVSQTCPWCDTGTMGLWWPVDTLQSSVSPFLLKGTSST